MIYFLPSLGKIEAAILVGFLLKEHVVDQEHRADQCGLTAYIQIHGES